MSTLTSSPPTASYDQWLAARKDLLAKEKALTRQYDEVCALRRRLPMVRIGKDYRFKGPVPEEKELGLRDLFAGHRQLIIYHFMFDPDWDKGCTGCTGFVDGLGDLSMLHERDTAFALVSRAPVAKLDRYRRERGWEQPWYSSLGSDFNYDFHATLDPDVAPMAYNFADKSNSNYRGESHGISVFFLDGDDVFHTYSSYARGVEGVTDAYRLLDLTPWGRQEDFEDSPPGWPQKPTYG